MKSFFTLLFIALLSTASIASAQSSSVQSPESYDDAVFQKLVTIQLVRSLESPLASIRSQSLKNAIVFTTLYREKIDLSSAISKIADVARNDESLSNRRMAVAALRAIGGYRADRYLAELEGMQESEYRSLVAGVLSEYYEQRTARL